MKLRRHIESFRLFAAVFAVAAWLTTVSRSSEVTTLDYRVTGVQLEVSPAALAVPKGIGGALHVRLV